MRTDRLAQAGLLRQACTDPHTQIRTQIGKTVRCTPGCDTRLV
ncbi:MAG: hypothetical protein ACR2OW_03645 [Methyloligellaceae bacterium]